MSKQASEHIARGKARIVEAPITESEASRIHQVEQDRNFELPTALYAATVCLYLAFLGVLFVGLSTPSLIIPMAIFVGFVVAGFGVPAIWTRLKGNETRPMTMGQFKQAGIMTNTGYQSARDAAIQMLILPVMIVLWACIAVTIAALV